MKTRNKNKTPNPPTKLSAFPIESENIVRKTIQSATTIPPYLTINLNTLLNILSIGLSIPVPPYNNTSNEVDLARISYMIVKRNKPSMANNPKYPTKP